MFAGSNLHNYEGKEIVEPKKMCMSEKSVSTTLYIIGLNYNSRDCQVNSIY